MYRVVQRLNVGIEWNPEVNEIGPLANLFFLTEDHWQPALSLGTSSDRIGTEEGTSSVYLTAAKGSPWEGLPVSGYASLNWSETDEGINFPFGGTIHLAERFGLGMMYDGQRSHLLASARVGRVQVTGLLVWLEHAGISISTGFGGRNP